MKRNAIAAVLSTTWAIQPEWLDIIASIAEREHEFAGNLEALEARLGRPLGNTMTATTRDGVAILPIEGPLFSKANLMTEFSGATSYGTLARDFTQAESDPAIRAHLLRISSPGGAVEGASEFAQMVAAATKPVWAFIEGNGASAAYWIASAADRVVAADTAIIGSIGAQGGITVRDPKPGEKAYRFVSSQSPLKNASPDTEAGANEMQALVDGQAQVFIEAVAKNRGILPAEVISSYGAGAVFVAAEAKKRGMIDEISTFEDTLKALKAETETMDFKTLTAASLKENRADLVTEIATAAVAEAMAGVEKVDAAAVKAAGHQEGVAAERKRIAEIEALAVPGAEAMIAGFKADGTEPAAAAMAILKAQKEGKINAGAAGHLQNLQNTEANLNPPKAGDGKDEPKTADEMAAAIVAAAGSIGTIQVAK